MRLEHERAELEQCGLTQAAQLAQPPAHTAALARSARRGDLAAVEAGWDVGAARGAVNRVTQARSKVFQRDSHRNLDASARGGNRCVAGVLCHSIGHFPLENVLKLGSLSRR